MSKPSSPRTKMHKMVRTPTAMSMISNNPLTERMDNRMKSIINKYDEQKKELDYLKS